jgi:BirA family biotin operon repressor/biotin-[acetyl-CoA-carboxylase] ligase
MAALGYEITEMGDRFILISPPPLEVDDIDAAFNIVVRTTVATTMDIAPRLIERGAKTPLVVFADEQTAGRGREGRRWLSPNRLGIYVTIAVNEETVSLTPTLTGLSAGLILASALEKEYNDLRGRIKLKWPNDLYIDGSKCAGILSVKKAGYLYIGCGVNVYHLKDDLPKTEHYDTTSLLLSGIAVEDRGRLAHLIMDDMLRALTAWDDEVIHNLWPKYDYFTGREVAVKCGEHSISGTAIGIGPSGELLVKTDTGVEKIVSGDVIATG